MDYAQVNCLIIGAGYSGRQIAAVAKRYGSVCVTCRTAASFADFFAEGISALVFDGVINQPFERALLQATHLIICVPPERALPLQDPVLRALVPWLEQKRGGSSALGSLEWIGYLSTIGVYGDHGGRWVDESTPCLSAQTRSLARREAELAWQRFAHDLNKPLCVLRLSGIYGPGRNAVLDALVGRTRMLIKPGQYFNRIHVEDLSRATVKAARHRYNGILNITDDTPAPPQEVIIHAHNLVGEPPPQAVAFETAELTSMARSFYSENKRVRNSLSKSVIDFHYRYPSYREGLDAIWQAVQRHRNRMQ